MTDTARSTSAHLSPADCLQLLVDHRSKWLRIAALFAVLSLVYALLMRVLCESRQKSAFQIHDK